MAPGVPPPVPPEPDDDSYPEYYAYADDEHVVGPLAEFC
jgi:hypothetical protein